MASEAVRRFERSANSVLSDAHTSLFEGTSCAGPRNAPAVSLVARGGTPFPYPVELQ